eukprot:SAG31_NODE_930_length_10920_cov_4.478329_2_plen_724_part_00
MASEVRAAWLEEQKALGLLSSSDSEAPPSELSSSDEDGSEGGAAVDPAAAAVAAVVCQLAERSPSPEEPQPEAAKPERALAAAQQAENALNHLGRQQSGSGAAVNGSSGQHTVQREVVAAGSKVAIPRRKKKKPTAKAVGQRLAAHQTAASQAREDGVKAARPAKAAALSLALRDSARGGASGQSARSLALRVSARGGANGQSARSVSAQRPFGGKQTRTVASLRSRSALLNKPHAQRKQSHCNRPTADPASPRPMRSSSESSPASRTLTSEEELTLGWNTTYVNELPASPPKQRLVRKCKAIRQKPSAVSSEKSATGKGPTTKSIGQKKRTSQRRAITASSNGIACDANVGPTGKHRYSQEGAKSPASAACEALPKNAKRTKEQQAQLAAKLNSWNAAVERRVEAKRAEQEADAQAEAEAASKQLHKEPLPRERLERAADRLSVLPKRSPRKAPPQDALRKPARLTAAARAEAGARLHVHGVRPSPVHAANTDRNAMSSTLHSETASGLWPAERRQNIPILTLQQGDDDAFPCDLRDSAQDRTPSARVAAQWSNDRSYSSSGASPHGRRGSKQTSGSPTNAKVAGAEAWLTSRKTVESRRVQRNQLAGMTEAALVRRCLASGIEPAAIQLAVSEKRSAPHNRPKRALIALLLGDPPRSTSADSESEGANMTMNKSKLDHSGTESKKLATVRQCCLPPNSYAYTHEAELPIEYDDATAYVRSL